MTFYVDDQEDADSTAGGHHEPGRGGRILTWFVMGALALITANIAIAAVGSRKTATPTPTPTPTPVGTLRPTAPPTRVPASPSPNRSPVVDQTAQVLPSLPLPTPGPPRSLYPDSLGAVTSGGEIVLIDAGTGRTLLVLETPQPGQPVGDISWDAANSIMYFDRGGTCPAVYRHRLDLGRAELFAAGTHPSVSPDGKKVAVLGTGCGPGGQQEDGVGVYSALTGLSEQWTPIGDTPAFSQPLEVLDADWRPDGRALAVAIGAGGNISYRLVSLSGATADVIAAPEIPVVSPFEEKFDQLEYVGSRLLLVGYCCEGGTDLETSRLALRQPTDAALTSVLQGPVFSASANDKGEIRYVAAIQGEAGPLRSVQLPPLGGTAGVNIGLTEFTRVDW